MKKIFSAFVVLGAFFCSAEKAPVPVPAPLRRAAVFKNGLAAVSREAAPAGKKCFYIGENMLPGIGTLWFTPSAVKVTKILREVEFKVPVPLTQINRLYKGRKITVSVLFGREFREFRGTVVTPKLPEAEIQVPGIPRPGYETVVALKLDDGRVVTLNRHTICAVESDAVPTPTETVKRQRPFWRIETPKPLNKLTVEYITPGLRWLPSYRARLGADGKMNLEFAATIENNLEDLKDIQMELVSGFPNLQFAGTSDPMAIFFAPPSGTQAGNLRYKRSASMFANQAAAETMFRKEKSRMAGSGDGKTFSAPVEDMVSLPIGKITLKKGETLRLPPTEGTSAYEKLVRWRIPARISERGRSVRMNFRGRDSEPMECLRFTNPFPTPITTAPLEILDRDRVVAQTKINWVNPKDEAIVELTKALTVTGKVVEYEAPNSLADKAERVFSSIARSNKNVPSRGWICGRSYRLADIKGEIELKNHRRNPAKIRIELQYSGELISAERNPTNKPADHPGMINPARQLSWEIVLKPGEELKLHYRYNVILDI